MEIREIIREKQPIVYGTLDVYIEVNRTKPKKKNDETLSENIIKDLMGHSSYRRGRGGIRQVR